LQTSGAACWCPIKEPPPPENLYRYRVSHTTVIINQPLILDGVLARSFGAQGAVRAALPVAVGVLSLEANEAEVAATLARHTILVFLFIVVIFGVT